MRAPPFVLAILVTAAATAHVRAQPAGPTPPPAPIAGDADAGREAFNADCRTCHAGGVAPLLRGVVGRKVASTEAFAGYTAALKAYAAETWTEQSLDAFLKAPEAFAPGTLMTRAVPEDQVRADIIAYLKGLSTPAE